MTDTVAQTYPTPKAGAKVSNLRNNSHSTESVPQAAMADDLPAMAGLSTVVSSALCKAFHKAD